MEATVVRAETKGVLGHGQRSGPVCFQTQYQSGTGTAAHYRHDGPAPPPAISGYSGHIAGKYAGNVIGGTWDKANDDSHDHLRTTAQAFKVGPMTAQLLAGV